MKFRVEVICVNDDGAEQRCPVIEMERRQLVMETLGLSLADGKTILHGVQDFVASQQTAEDLQRRRNCPGCGQRYHSKGIGTHTVQTVFGAVPVPNPRWERCSCQRTGPKTFRPSAAWLQGRTSPELLYLETKWGSLIPFEKVADLLKEVLPVGESTNHETVREHLQAIAERMEADLGEERPLDPVGPQPEEHEQQLPDGPMTVGIDGGYVRAAHKKGCFEVIAGRSVVAFRRAEEEEVPPAKCFGFVQTYDQKPRRRLWEVLKSQGMQENQQVVFMSDGGDDVRQVQEYLHPNSEHVLDWFHITMRLTVLQQQTKSLPEEGSQIGAAASKQVESVKHLLWHGNVEEALDRVADLLMDLDLIRKHSAPAEKLSVGLAEFETYIRNNRESIPNFGERYRQGGDDQHSVRRIDNQPGGEPAVREAAADALDPTGCASASANADRGAERRTRRCLSGMVPVIPGSRSSCCVTPGLLLLSSGFGNGSGHCRVAGVLFDRKSICRGSVSMLGVRAHAVEMTGYWSRVGFVKRSASVQYRARVRGNRGNSGIRGNVESTSYGSDWTGQGRNPISPRLGTLTEMTCKFARPIARWEQTEVYASYGTPILIVK